MIFLHEAPHLFLSARASRSFPQMQFHEQSIKNIRPGDYPLRQDNHSSHDKRDRQIQKQTQKIQTEISAKILPQHFPLKNQQKCTDTN